jgi:hypothetical protein
MFVRGSQGQGQGVHAPALGGAEFGGQGGMDGAGARDPGDPLKGGADQKHAVVRLTTRRGAGMAGMVGAVVLDVQQDGCERLGQNGPQAVGTGRVGLLGHSGVIGRFLPIGKLPCSNCHAQIAMLGANVLDLRRTGLRQFRCAILYRHGEVVGLLDRMHQHRGTASPYRRFADR